MSANRHRPEIARTRLDLAELLLDHYPDERPEALEHLDFAIGELRDMKMQPALERALGLQAGLEAKPIEKPAYPVGLAKREGEVLRLADEALRSAVQKSTLRTVHPDGLSEREVEVLGLVAAGKTDREISELLFISPRTVSNHVASILGKTDSANRAA